IDNRVFIPTEDEETGEVISPEEQRRIEDEERAERERRIKEEVDARVAQVLSDRSEALERERKRIIEDARNEAASITADAKATTMAVIEKANRECVKIKEIARQEGLAQGFSEGKEESLDKYRKYIDAAGKLLSEINARKEAYYISNEDDLRATVFEVAQKVVHAELKASPEVIENILADAAKNFRNSDYIKIILSEEDMTERFKTDEKLINKIIPFIPDIEIVFDEDTEEGTIVLDNGSEIVDASIPTQLDFLKEILNNTRGVSDGDEGFEPDSLSDRTDSLSDDMSAEALGGVEVSEEFPAEISSELAGDTSESMMFEESMAVEVHADVPVEEPLADGSAIAAENAVSGALAALEEAEAAVQNAAAEAFADNAAETAVPDMTETAADNASADDDGFAGSLLDGVMENPAEIPMDIPADVPADDFVSAVSEAVDTDITEAVPVEKASAAETAETKKSTKKRTKKSEE
ncbi:MAG: hypothetical protein K2H90_05735, partial [Oscillospiraceae bacterium]|nr:hypothetical protein [Oscillospiraceae bacterium]